VQGFTTGCHPCPEGGVCGPDDARWWGSIGGSFRGSIPVVERRLGTLACEGGGPLVPAREKVPGEGSEAAFTFLGQ